MKTKLIWLAIVTLLAALMISGTAFAEGEVPPALPEEPAAEVAETAPPAEEPSAPAEPDAPAEPAPEAPSAEEPADETALMEAPAAETPTDETALMEAPAAEAPTDETALMEAPAVEAAAPEEAAPTQAVEEPALETQPVVELVDDSGDSVDMASQESAELVSSGDPRWKVGTQWYSVIYPGGTCYPGTSTSGPNQTCWEVSDNLITFALGQMSSTGLPTDRKLYVEAGDYTESNLVIGSSLSLLNGLIGLDGSGSTTINGNVTIENNVGGFTLSGFTINGAVDFSENTGTLVLQDLEVQNSSDDGIRVGKHNGSINVTNVRSHNNYDGGAHLENTSGNVTINASIFNDNDYRGLEVVSKGVVTLNTVTASGNGTNGIYIETISTVTLTNIKANDNIGDSGIQVSAPLGLVTVNNAVANDNGFDGLTIEGRGVTIRNAVARFNDNSGLYVYLRGGAGLLENVVANDNEWYGVEVGSYPNVVAALTLKYMDASNNANDGIHVETLGAVTVTNSTTDNNFRDSEPDTGGDGLYIATKGAVTLTGIWSSGNGGNGLKVQGIYVLDPVLLEYTSMLSPTAITLTSAADPNFANYFSGNGKLGDDDLGMNGITILTQKPVTIRNFSVNDNLGSGLEVHGPWLYNAEHGYGYGGSGAVAITSTLPNWRNAADRNNQIGVYVFSTGAVSLSGLNTNENNINSIRIAALGAITLSNVRDWGNGGGNTISLYNNISAGIMPVTITNLEVRETRGGSDAALKVHSKGAITISGLWLENNNSMGASLNNMPGTGAISLTNAQINNNALTGIEANSKGAIVFTNVSANWNGWAGMRSPDGTYFGADLSNANALTAMAVTLTDCVFEGNQGSGLWVESKGLITLRGVETRWNYIRYGFMSDGQTVYETNQPEWNGDEGEWVNFDEMKFNYSSGDVTIILRSLDEGNMFQPIVELRDSNWDIVASGTPTDGDGIWTLDIGSGTLDSGTYTIRVLFEGLDDEYSNGYGPYSLSVNDDLEENHNIPADGAVLDNHYSTAVTPAGVTASSTASHIYNLFEGNNRYGLNIITRGAVTLTNLYANSNTFGEGLFMNNEDAIGAVTVQNLPVTNPASFSSNGGNGLYIRTRGAITLSNVEAYNNLLSGADLDNAICTWDDINGEWTNCLGTGAITLRGPSGQSRWFNDNQHFGIWTWSTRRLTLTNISTVNNGYDGAFLRNNRANSSALLSVGTSGAVRNEFNNNGWNTDRPTDPENYYYIFGSGLTVVSGGNISVLNSAANWNQNGGGGLILANYISVLPKTVLVSGVETYHNDWVGIWIESKGAITLTNASVSDNGYDGGIHLDNCKNSPGGCQGSGGVTMTGLDVNNNGGEGLIVYSKGAISLTNAWVNNNKGSGIHLVNNYNYIGTLTGITMTNVNVNDNQGMGLEALSRGLITLRGGEGSNNWGNGIRLQNNFEGATAGITILNASAYNNSDTGISLETNGALLMTSLAASDNARTGGGLTSGETVQDFFNQDRGMDNWWFDAEADVEYTLILKADTLELYNKTDFWPEIELIDPSAEDGWENPLDITGLYTCDAAQCVLTFTPEVDLGFSEDITLVLKVGSAYGDGFYRVFMNVPIEELDDVPDRQYYVEGLVFNAGGNVTMTGYNSFHHNSLTGLVGLGAGNISLTNAAAFSNGTEGIYLDNRKCHWDEDLGEDVCTGIGNILMSGANVANNNGWEGLHVETNGTVNILKLEASNNSQRADQDDTLAAVAINAYGSGKAVTLANITALNNMSDGLQVVSEGSATFTNVRAWMNGTDGLDVTANGLVTFTSVNAWLNGGNGVYVDSNAYLIKALTSTFTCNGQDGFGFVGYPSLIPITTGSSFWGNDGTDFKEYH